MGDFDVIIIGGGAAGVFAAAVLAEGDPGLNVLVLEQAAQPLAKVRVSGGGRCNLTHRCTDIRTFVQNYPRGGNELIGPFHRFGPAETIAWFEARGVPLETLEDGCVFPRSDTSESIIQCLLSTTRRGAAQIRTGSTVTGIRRHADGFEVTLDEAATRLTSRKLLVTTGGGSFVTGLDHAIEPCVPALFALNTPDREFTALAGIVEKKVRVSAAGQMAEGELLITHSGVSGPAVLRLSSVAARPLAAAHYQLEMTINWNPEQNLEGIGEILERTRTASPRKQTGTWSPLGLSARLWQLLLRRAGVDETCEWGSLSLKSQRQIASQIGRFTLPIRGKNRHRQEFVTCGGIRRKEINFQTLESRLHPGLYFAGEVIDIDALTGGFNLQAAWTTGYLAAQALKAALHEKR